MKLSSLRGVSTQTEAYWEERGRVAASSELEAICYPSAPPLLNRYAAWSQRRTVGRLLRLVEPLDGKRVLDIGCGTGRWSRLVADRGGSVIGVDRSVSMVKEAKRRSPEITFRRMDAVALLLPDDGFDLAIAVTVIQHLSYDEQVHALGELARVVRPGGHVLSVDRTGIDSDFSRSHGTFPRPRAEWVRLWRSVGAQPIRVYGQEFSYPLRLAAIGRFRSVVDGAGTDPTRRGGAGWRKAALNVLVAASAFSELIVGGLAPAAPAEHVAVLYRLD